MWYIAMLEIIIAIAVIGSVIAGLWDLKTTEVPEEIPFLVMLASLAGGLAYGIGTGDFAFLFNSLVVGTVLLAAGMAIYYRKQWGAADAWMLASVGYAIPYMIIPFVINFFIVAVVYMVVYSIILGMMKKGTFALFAADVRKNMKYVFGIPAAFLVAIVPLYIYSAQVRVNPAPLVITFILVVFLSFFWRYAKIIEQNVFRKTIDVLELRVGDVIEGGLIDGASAEQVASLKKKGGHVTIKEGIRFVPVFPISLIVTIVYGNLIFYLL